MTLTQPKPPSVLARRRNGSPRRLDMPAQDLEQILPLLRTSDSLDARRLVKRLELALQPICNWSSPRRARWGGDWPAWGMCAKAVDKPADRCREHAHWPLREGASDPWPSRCEATLDAELDEDHWRSDSAGLRCPYGKRANSDRCVHHDPRTEELCSAELGTGDSCTVPESIYPCPRHRAGKLKRLSESYDRLALNRTCRTCAAGDLEPCVTRSGRPVAFHAVRQRDARTSPAGASLLEEISFFEGAGHPR